MVGEPAAATETAQIEARVKSALITDGLNVQTVSMTPTIDPGFQQTINWRVDLTYLGDPIVIDSMVVAAIGGQIMGLGGVHLNSLWQEHGGLVTVSHEPAR